MFTDRNGRPCQASDDTLVAVIIQLMPKSLEESVMFAEGFQELYDRLHFTLKGSADDDFGEWTQKVRTFMLARFGDETLTALTWAARQQRIVVETCVALQRNRMISWNTVFGDQAAEDEIDDTDDFVGKLYAYLVSFTSDAAKQDRSEFPRRKWLGSLETTAQRVRPDIVHETCGDPAAGPEPTALPAS